MFYHQVPILNESKLSSLVENRQIYDMASCQLNVFETHQEAAQVELQFDDLVLTTMLRGKKIMHLPNRDSFDYHPGESVLVKPSEKMVIDFPEAKRDDPTQCLALAISQENIRQAVSRLNEKLPLEPDLGEWTIQERMFHLTNDQGLENTISRIIELGIYNQTSAKDVFIDLTLQELIYRLLQTQARQLIELEGRQLQGKNRFAYIDCFIKDNIHEKIDVDQLADKACMSRPNFFRRFKQYFGVSPNEYIQQQKLKTAKKYLIGEGKPVNEVAFMLGYQNMNQLIRIFKSSEGMTPKQFQIKHRI